MMSLSKAIKDAQATTGSVYYGVGGYCYNYPEGRNYRTASPCSTRQQAVANRAKHVAREALQSAGRWHSDMEYTLYVSSGSVQELCRIAIQDNPVVMCGEGSDNAMSH